MGNKDEEDVFNALMSTPTGKTDNQEEDLPAAESKRCVVEFSFDGNESIEQLVDTFKDPILTEMEKIGDLESHLKTRLGSFFERVRGAWEQYKEGAVDLTLLIQAGITVLRKEFINAFVETERKVAATPSSKEEISPSAASVVKFPSGLFKREESSEIASENAPPKVEQKPGTPVQPDSVAPAEKKSPPTISVSSLTAQKPTIQPKPPEEKPPSEESPSLPQKIESVAPKKEFRSSFEAMGSVDEQLAKVKLDPLKFDKIDEAELKMVNVGKQTPGSPLFDEFGEVEDLLHKQAYKFAEKKLKDLKILAENRNLDYQVERAEEMLMNLSVYKMLPSLIESGDKYIDEDPKKAEEKYNKALKFAKILGDSYYITQIDTLLTQANQRMVFRRKKRLIQKEEEEKTKNLIKDNIQRLGKQETLSSIEEIRKYCNAKTEELVEEILVEMIENKQIYAKYFPSSKKVMFDKENNRELLIKGL